MQKEELDILLLPVESVNFYFTGDEGLPDQLFGAKDGYLPSDWFEVLTKESAAMLQELQDEELKEQIAFLRAVAEYAHNCAVTGGLYAVHHIGNMLDVQFYFASHGDVKVFEEGLEAYIETI